MGYNFEAHNKGNRFAVNTEGFEYKKLKDLYETNGPDHVYTVCAIYINRSGRYGDAPVFATPEYYVNLPSHLLKDAEDFLASSDAIESINERHMGFRIYSYELNGNVNYSVSFVNL